MKTLLTILILIPLVSIAQTSKQAPEDLAAYLLPLSTMKIVLRSADGKNIHNLSYIASTPSSNKCKDNPNKICGYSYPLEKRMDMILGVNKIAGPTYKYTVSTTEKLAPTAITRIGVENAGTVDSNKILGLEAGKDVLFSKTDKISEWYGLDFSEGNLTLNLKSGKFSPCIKLYNSKDSLSVFACKGFGVVKTEDSSSKPSVIYEAVSIEKSK
ncbi:MAG TPA: hypothetical protein VF412_06285 [Bdellovibrio sp.]|uniref:hypothetical protein n=1 Tax=Bdellovibrio sp. TaxID=28201 RepID=UPI002EE2BCE3